MEKQFLTAEWRKLIIANYVVEPELLLPYLPYKTEIDLWKGRCYVSLVGFRFLNTRVMGLKIPFHSDFEEVNLRFYVRYKENDDWKRGVVFIREIVPRPAITFVANFVYKENYETLPTRHFINGQSKDLVVEYGWKKKGNWNILRVSAAKEAELIKEGSEEEFITEHYWGYTKLSANRTAEYKVEHPKWEVYNVRDFSIEVDFAQVYGSQFSFLTSQKPASVMLAEGSAIKVYKGKEFQAQKSSQMSE